MEFITVEQFKEQPKEVQKVFLDWWQPRVWDIFIFNTDEYDNSDSNIGVLASLKQISITRRRKGEYRIPLFTEDQLRKFIEDKTNGIVKLIQWNIEDSQVSKRGYAIDILRKNEYHVTYHYQDLGEDLLQAYWKVACMIAKDEDLNNK